MKFEIEVIEEYNPCLSLYIKKLKYKNEIFSVDQSIKCFINTFNLLNKTLIISDKKIKNYDFASDFITEDCDDYIYLDIKFGPLSFCIEDFSKVFKKEIPKEIFIKIK